MRMPKKVKIRELGPREGFQTLKQVVPTEAKLRLIEALSQTGVSCIELTSFVRPDRVPQMADAADIVRDFVPVEGVQYTALYLNPKGFVRAEETGRLNNDAWLYCSASRTFLERNNNTDHASLVQQVPEWLEIFETAKRSLHGIMISTAFGCNYEGAIAGEVVLSTLSDIYQVVEARGHRPKEISLADTMGWAHPHAVHELVHSVRKEFSGPQVSLHLHDTRGLGIACVYAGLELGVEIFESSVAGMGGCPFAVGAAGNVATEDVVHLCHSLGVETGISLQKYVEAAKIAEEIVGIALPGKLYKTYSCNSRS